MLKYSALIGMIGMYILTSLFVSFGTDIIQAFVIYDIYILFSFICGFKMAKGLREKAIYLYLSITWLSFTITDILYIDFSLILTMLGSLFIYTISAKKLVNIKKSPTLDFKHNYVIHCPPFKWYHWGWILVGGDVDAYRMYYNSEQQLLIRMENGVLVERDYIGHDLIKREISAINADVSIAKVSYEELSSKLGKPINCKKEIY